MRGTPRAERLHIAIFGRRNAGKSSLINALADQRVAIVSGVPGTTTDPVFKSMELPPIGPVTMIDTAGLDDEGSLGKLRVEKTLDVFNRTDLALLVIDPFLGFGEPEKAFLSRAKDSNTPVIAVVNKSDLNPPRFDWKASLGIPAVSVSALRRIGIDRLKMAIVEAAPSDWAMPSIVGDLLQPGDLAVLVIPIDKAAPRGRLILPQQQVIRDVLDRDSMAAMVKDRDLAFFLSCVRQKPRIVVADSSAYARAVADTPPDVLFTSFSILFARYKGDLETLAAGVKAAKNLKAGAKVLVAEACTHHPVEDDIGRVKIPRWLRQASGGDLAVDVVSGGGSLPHNVRDYDLVVHCGACMLTRKEMLYRMMQAKNAGVPIVNYGVMMAEMHGVLRRALSPFPGALAVLDDGEERLSDFVPAERWQAFA